MINCTYIIAEGTLDVAFLAKILECGFSGRIIKNKADLPEPFSRWLETFKWPQDNDISRRAVPAPAFLSLAGTWIIIRNAEGLSKVRRTMTVDKARFEDKASNIHPNAIGLILDSDDKPISRFEQFAALLKELNYTVPNNPDTVNRTGSPRTGIFTIPGNLQPGCLEDLLLPVIGQRFPGLAEYAGKYVENWGSTYDYRNDKDFEELKKDSGKKKRRFQLVPRFLNPPNRSRLLSKIKTGWLEGFRNYPP